MIQNALNPLGHPMVSTQCLFGINLISAEALRQAGFATLGPMTSQLAVLVPYTVYYPVQYVDDRPAKMLPGCPR